MSALAIWFHYGISLRTAWQVAGVIHPSPAQEAEHRRMVRETIEATERCKLCDAMEDQ